MNNLPGTIDECLVKSEWYHQEKRYTTYFLARYVYERWIDDDGECIPGEVVNWTYCKDVL